MKVLKFSQQPPWFLLEDTESLFFSTLCEHGFCSAGFLIKLSDEEKERYLSEGEEYLHKLSKEINSSQPLHKNSQSKYTHRNLDEQLSKEFSEAVDNFDNPHRKPVKKVHWRDLK